MQRIGSEGAWSSLARAGITARALGGMGVAALLVGLRLACIVGCGDAGSARIRGIQSLSAEAQMLVSVGIYDSEGTISRLSLLVWHDDEGDWRRLFSVREDVTVTTSVAASADGRLIAVIGGGVRVFDEQGRLLLHAMGLGAGGYASAARWSPTSDTLAVGLRAIGPRLTKRLELWDPVSQARTVLAEDVEETFPIEWSSNGRWIAFISGSSRNGGQPERALVVQEVRGDARKVLARGMGHWVSAKWRPDSDTIAWTRQRGEGTRRETELWVRNLQEGRARRVFRIRGYVGSLAWSPDGQWLAFMWSDAGRDRPCVIPAKSVLKSEGPLNAREVVICLPRRAADGRLYGWNASNELLVSKDAEVVQAFDPRSRRWRIIFDLRREKGLFAQE